MRKYTWINVEKNLKRRFPGLEALICRVRNLKVKSFDAALEEMKSRVLKEMRERYNLGSLKDEPMFRFYRDFYWKIGLDPTKTRPAAEALIRRVLRGKPLPRINTLVDSYNLASMETGVAMATFDENKLKGNLKMREAETGEVFIGIGMNKPVTLRGGEIVVSDKAKIVAIYPYRDADNSKVTSSTTNALLMVCGVPGITSQKLVESMETALRYIQMFCGGTIEY